MVLFGLVGFVVRGEGGNEMAAGLGVVRAGEAVARSELLNMRAKVVV